MWLVFHCGSPLSSYGDGRLSALEDDEINLGVLVRWAALSIESGCTYDVISHQRRPWQLRWRSERSSTLNVDVHTTVRKHVRYSWITADKWHNDLASEDVVEEHLIECSCEQKMSLCTDDVAKV